MPARIHCDLDVCIFSTKDDVKQFYQQGKPLSKSQEGHAAIRKARGRLMKATALVKRYRKHYGSGTASAGAAASGSGGGGGGGGSAAGAVAP